MKGKIALEEHFALEETLQDSLYTGYFERWPDIRRRLLDFHELRLQDMDRHGIEYVILGLQNPGVQRIPDARRAVDLARRANDLLADSIANRQDRFGGFATLPMQDPEMAIVELTRCVRQLGFKGTMVNGFSQIGDLETAVYLDDPRYLPFWEQLEKFQVPLYLHPREPLLSHARIYEGHPWLSCAAWGFGVETATHALRLMGSGLFDRFPKVNVILGHLGEGLPFSIWRVDHWISQSPRGIPARRRMTDYLRSNFYLTTSGNFRTPTFMDTMMEVGSERMLFSVDYPFEKTDEAVEWFDNLEISEADLSKIGRTNAVQLFRLEEKHEHL